MPKLGEIYVQSHALPHRHENLLLRLDCMQIGPRRFEAVGKQVHLETGAVGAMWVRQIARCIDLVRLNALKEIHNERNVLLTQILLCHST